MCSMSALEIKNACIFANLATFGLRGVAVGRTNIRILDFGFWIEWHRPLIQN